MNSNDFKYVIHDMTNIYVGAKLSYGEMMELDEMPFKLKTIISHYMLREVAADTTIENHIFYITRDSMSYMVYKQMKARFKMSVFKENGHGKGKPGYVSQEYRIDDILDNEEIIKKRDQIVVEEMHITKLGMMAVGI